MHMHNTRQSQKHYANLTEFLALFSSSSCSKELANSLNKPTSSQFFRKRVGVGVWSGTRDDNDGDVESMQHHHS